MPLALVFAGVIIGSMHGVDSEKEVFPTPAPRATTAPLAAGTTVSGTVLQIAARNLLFDKRALTAAAAAPVTISFDNQDASVLHNVTVYTDNRATTKIFGGDLITGPSKTDYKFTAPAAGTYYFRCDVHPDTMNGSFTVR